MLRVVAFACLFSLCASGSARAEPQRTRLGVAFGASFPHGELSWDPAFAWGFFVDLPLTSWFYLSPSTLVYELDREGVADGFSATDISNSFKFAFDVDMVELFAGFTVGLTSSNDLDVHFGGVGGLNFNVVEQFDVSVAVNYKVILDDASNINDLKILAGPAFRF